MWSWHALDTVCLLNHMIFANSTALISSYKSDWQPSILFQNILPHFSQMLNLCIFLVMLNHHTEVKSVLLERRIRVTVIPQKPRLQIFLWPTKGTFILLVELQYWVTVWLGPGHWMFNALFWNEYMIWSPSLQQACHAIFSLTVLINMVLTLNSHNTGLS